MCDPVSVGIASSIGSTLGLGAAEAAVPAAAGAAAAGTAAAAAPVAAAAAGASWLPYAGLAASALGAGATLIGSMNAANAQRQQAQAIADANQANLRSQNEGFTSRLSASRNQTEAQSAAANQTLEARNQAAAQMRAGQQQRLQDYQAVVDAQNAQAEQYRQAGDVASQQLLQGTTADQLAQAEAARRQQTMAALNANQQAEGPQETNPEGSQTERDPAYRAAAARRTAEAATNIREYGSKLAAADAYAASPQSIGLNIADTKYGIMPAAQAASLLASGSNVRLLPSKLGYGSATGMGQVQDALIASRGQNALDVAGLDYANRIGVANLSQADAEQLTKNALAQKTVDAQAREAQAGILTGLGNLGLKGGGYILGGGGPTLASGFNNLKTTLGSIFT